LNHLILKPQPQTGAPTPHGFTLIEIMIVMFIISILMLIAIPVYTDYRVRTKVSEGIGIAGAVTTQVSEYRMTQNRFPTSNAEAGISPPADYHTKYVAMVTINSTPSAGSITITFNSTALPALGANNTIVFVPDFDGTRIDWDCRHGALEDTYRPANCRK